MNYRRIIVGVLALTCLFTVSACNKDGGKPAAKPSQSSSASEKTPKPVKVPPAPEGWVNSTDGIFRVQIPTGYLDAMANIKPEAAPDARVVLAMPSSAALYGAVPNVVIDKAKVITDASVVKNTISSDAANYPDMHDFETLDPPKNGELNVLYVDWKYSFRGTPYRAYVCFVSGNNNSYAIKQELPEEALGKTEIVIPGIVTSWTWNSNTVEKS